MRNAEESEDQIQGAIVDYLKIVLPKDAWYCSIPNGAHLAGDEKARARQMAKLKWTGLRPGAPDLFIVWRDLWIAFEVKTATGKLTPAQIECHKELFVNNGIVVHVIRSIDDMTVWLRHYGLIR